ncbi:MAG: helix-turn-helix domain-containing protein [Verrucomicrobiae bacterium]|nr:helix-turn-helix domain-containing protein [Verrucomicrobiae bacterium]
MAETIGSRLRATRESKGMSIEDVAFETRIHANFIRCLEADDYSHFASTTYAKSFLSLYSRFLEVDAAEALHFFAGSDDIRLGGQPLLATIKTVESARAPRVTRASRQPERKATAATVTVRRESPGFAPIFLGVLVFLLLGAIPALWYLGKDADSIDEVASKAKEIAEVSKVEIASAAASVEPNTVPAEQANTTTTPAPKPKKKDWERSAAADWVLEESGSRDESIGGSPADSTLEESVGGETPSAEKAPGVPAKTDPGPAASAVVAVAVPTENLDNAPRLTATPTSEESFGAAKPTDSDDPAPAVAQEKPKSKANSKREDITKPEPAEIPEPEAETETAPAVATPLRAVPLIATPVSVSEEEVPAADDGATVSEEETTNEAARPARAADEEEENEETRNFVDPRHRFPRPLN